MVIGPRQVFFAMLFTFAALGAASANNVYLAQTAQGTGSGADCADPLAVAYFNSSSNWSSTPTGMKIGPATTVHLCGTISTNLTFQGNGSSGNPVVLDGANATMNAWISTGVTQYWTIQNFTWNTSYATNSGTQSAINIMGGAANGTVQNNHIDIQNSGRVIFLYNANNIVIKNNYLRMYSPAGDGFDSDVVDWAGATNVTLQGNYMELNINGDGSCSNCHDDIIQTWAYNGNPTNATIRYNWFVNNTPTNGPANLSWCMLQYQAGTWNVYSNVFLTSQSGTGDTNGCGFGGFDQGGTYYVYNNTFVGRNSFATLLNGGGGTMYARNNILYRDTCQNSSNGLLFNNGGTINYDHNAFYSPCTADFPTFSGGCSSQTGDICSTSSSIAATLFSNYSGNDFSLGSGSAAIGVGANLGTSYNQAISAGATWPNPTLATWGGTWDIGAYDPNGSSAPTPPTGLAAIVN